MTIEEAAKKYADYRVKENYGSQFDFVRGDIKDAFTDGAEWQRKNDNTIRSNNKKALANALEELKKYQWRNVVETLPYTDDKLGHISDNVLLKVSVYNKKHKNTYTSITEAYYDSDMNIWHSMFAVKERNLEITAIAWMPIPTFDEILENNKDVLERIKGKGD